MITIRALRRDDRLPIKQILLETGNFTKVEIEVALELIDIYLDRPEQKDYILYCAVDQHDRVAGYVCYGPTPMTEGTWDLYWIAVDPKRQGSGVGKALLDFVENRIQAQNARLLMIETSSKPNYNATRQFYFRQNYQEIARIPDFYAVGDDRVIYRKRLR